MRILSRPMPDAQMDLLEARLASIGVGRRDFLKVAGAMAAFGGLGFASTAQAAHPSKPRPGERLAKEQLFRFGGGGWYQNDPSSHDFNKDLYCNGIAALFAGLMVFNADFVAVPWMATKVEGNKDGSMWTFTIRKDSRWSDNAPVSARDFEWSWKRQLDPASAAPYASFLYDIKNGEAFNKKKITDASQVGVRA
ncbi:MAG TPA: ABC transporter substrate-binding protein, partial [Gemmatimonadales bacterium]|nr:ABC transporter substrate-binding protein [Gemmatimonadales bacterium]